MKQIINFDFRYTSSCETCGSSFNITQDTKIIPYRMFCSYKCRFLRIFKRLSELEQKTIVSYASLLLSNKKSVVCSQSLIFDISKLLVKFELKTLNTSAQGSAQEITAQLNELVSAQNVGSSGVYIPLEPMSRAEPMVISASKSLSRQEVLDL